VITPQSGETGSASPPFRPRRALGALRFLILVGLFLAAFPPAARPQEAEYSEFQVKAAFILNFHKFIGWPEASHVSATTSETLCVLGDDPLGPILAEVRRKDFPGTKLTILRIDSLEGVRDCRILYVAPSEKGRIRLIVEALAGAPVLTVADVEGGARQGIMIAFFLDEAMVRFEINAEAMRRAGLSASAKLLKIARVLR